jgi:transposase
LADVAAGTRVRKRSYLLAETPRLAEGGPMAATTEGLAGRTGQDRTHRLVESGPRFRERPDEKGGEHTGPNPVDRGRAGTKHHLLVDREGVPLAATISAANIHDSKLVEQMVDSVEPIKGGRGRPRKRPEKLHADKGYDYPRCRRFLRRRGIKARIARRGIESSEKLGRHRWVVERSFSWLYRFRRLTVRYERRADIHQAFLDLACSLICCNYLRGGY